MTQQANIENVLTSLNDLILDCLKGVSSQQYFPCSNPDESDTRIKEGKERAHKLRQLREEFENIVTGVLR